MLYLFLCIAANVGIFTSFRAFKHYGVDTFPAIVINYVVCVITGLLFAGNGTFRILADPGRPWMLYALALGAIFIGTFYLMARTTQIFSMTVSSIASKMSLVIPVLFSLLILDLQSREYSPFNYAGMITAVLAIAASSFRRAGTAVTSSRPLHYLLPVAVFLLGGTIDSTINYVSFRFLGPGEEAVFPIVIFMSAGLIGSVALLIQRRPFSRKSVIGGIALGVVNYFSVYYLVRSLSSFGHDGAIVYPLINVGIILFSSGVSAVFFREKFSLVNAAGIILAILSIGLLSHQEIFQAI